MGLKCGLVGLPGCGKTTIFNAITAAGVTGYGTEMNRAVVNVPDPRIDRLVEMYQPAKTVPATLEVVDIPGIAAGSTAGEGRGTSLLGLVKDVDVILHVVQCFAEGLVNPLHDTETIDLELMVADSQTLRNKIDRIAKKAKMGNAEAQRDLANSEKVRDGLAEGVPARRQNLTEQERASVAECNLLSLKPVLYIANLKSMNDTTCVAPLEAIARAEGSEVVPICGRDEYEITLLPDGERQAFLEDLGLTEPSVARLLRAGYHMLNLVSFFTVGQDEVRAWTCRRGDTAPTAAGKVHSDMEKGFIRMEVIRYEDLVALGSEAAVAKAGKKRVEGRLYEVQDGDIVFVLFNPPR